MLAGLDLSYANRITPNLTPYSVVIVKAYESNVGQDDRWDQHSTACRVEFALRPAHFTWGAYLFLMPTAAGFPAPEVQVAAFLRIAGDAPLIVIDWEKDEGTPWPRPTLADLARAKAALKAAGKKVICYASALAPYPEMGWDGRWKAFYGQTPAEPWDGWQYAGSGLDRSWWKPSVFALAGQDPVEAAVARFISASGYNPASLPHVSIPAGTVLRDLAGNKIGTIGPTTLPTSGLVDGHSDQRSVLVKTGRYFTDGQLRPVWQAATVDPATPVQQPDGAVSTHPDAIALAVDALPLVA